MILTAAYYRRLENMRERALEVTVRLPERRLLDAGVFDVLTRSQPSTARERLRVLLEKSLDAQGRTQPEKLTDAEYTELRELLEGTG